MDWKSSRVISEMLDLSVWLHQCSAKVVLDNPIGEQIALAKSQWIISLPPELHGLVEAVLAKPSLQQRLAPIPEADAFVAEAAAVAREQGIALDTAILTNVLRPDPLGFGRFAEPPILGIEWPPLGWLPARTVATGSVPAFDWQYFGTQRLSSPFFEDEVRRAGFLPFNWLFRIRTSLDTLVAGSGAEPEIPLHGLIFHMSRCGSTLLAQMLAAVPENMVSSEPEPLDGIIQWARLADVPPETAVISMRAIVAALARDRDPDSGAKYHIIKLDAWHAFSLPLFRAAFPAVNWVHVYRDSVEVMVSTMQQPGVHTAPGLLPEKVIGFGADTATSLEDFSARVLAGIGEAIVAHHHLGGGMLVGYPDIIEAAAGAIPQHFKLSLDANSKALMVAAAECDAKDPGQRFVGDVSRKRTAATTAINEAVQRWMLPVEAKMKKLSKPMK